MGPVHYREGAFPADEYLDWRALVPLLGPAAAAVARHDGMLAAIPNHNVLLATLFSQEAVLSSRIEGTQATLEEVLEYEAGKEPASSERREDVIEVMNYRHAMRHAEHMLSELPLSLRVIRETHSKLLTGGRGKNADPGNYRRVPNWIGPPGCSVENASFVPISASKVPEAMGRWERYMHQEDGADQLVQLALLHAEFEAIHPFLDGNGRLGRMVIPLFLWQKKLIRAPTFYISAYFESHREEYYERLLAVSRDGDCTGWCKFFLRAVQTQAQENVRKTHEILDLYGKLKDQIPGMTRSPNAVLALDWIFERPVSTSVDFAREAGISTVTASRLLDAYSRNEILQVISRGSGRSPKTFLFGELLAIAEVRV